MLVIENIKIKFFRNLIPVKIKSITASYNRSQVSNQKNYQQIGSHEFQWRQSMTLPLYYNVPLELVCKGDQNYQNPEDPNQLLTTSIKIIDYKSTFLEGTFINKSNQKVANLFLKFRVLNQKMVVPPQKGAIYISSLLAHFDSHYGSKGITEIILGYKQLFTPTVKVIAGELLWSEEIIIPLEETNSVKGLKETMIMKINVDEKEVGVVKFTLESIKNSNVKYKKFGIKATQDEKNKIGTLFLDISYKQSGAKIEEIESFNSLPLKKTQKLLGFKQSSQKIISNQNIFSFKKQEKQSQTSKSQRILPILSVPRNQSQSLIRLDSKIERSSQRKSKKSDLFNDVFDLGGAFQKQQNIRQIFRERRRKKQNKHSLPKLK